MSLRIEVPKKYDLLLSVHSWIYPDIQPVPEMTGSDYLGRIFRIDGTEFPFIFQQERPGSRIGLLFPDDSVSKKDAKLLARRVLGLDINMNGALSFMKQDPLLEPIAASVAGVRPYIADSLFEALAKSIIQQQISYRAANVVAKRMVLGMSKKHRFSGLDLYSFPSASVIMNQGLEGLREYGIGYRTEYVHEVSSLVASGKLDLDPLEGKSFPEIMEVLGPIRGIGEWTVQIFMIAGFGDLTIFPYGDLALQNILGGLYNNGNRMSKNEVIEKSTEWGKEGPSIMYFLMSAYVLGLGGF